MMESLPTPTDLRLSNQLNAERISENDVRAQFKELQQNFVAQYESVYPDKMAYKTVVIIPSLTLDQEILQKIDGVNYYEERLLCLLMLLRMPHTHITYVTSMPVDQAIVDYYLHLLPGITSYHARQRLTLLSCFDASSQSLTHKILDRPRLIERIRKSVPYGHLAHIACFNVTSAERTLALALQMPIYGCDPDLLELGNKSFSRKIFKATGINTPPGFEDLSTEADIVQALYKLKIENPSFKKAVIKLNDGFSGEGNAVFSYTDAPKNSLLQNWIKNELPDRIQIVAKDVSYLEFLQKFNELGGIVEAFLEGSIKHSPSVQCIINPLGKIDVASTHDQLLGGKNGQVYLGASFPANSEYALDIGKMGRVISEELKRNGVIGRFSVDFISVKENEEWKHYAIEINLRKGGTTHPYLMLQFLTVGDYNADDGNYYTANQQKRCYICSDNLQNDQYKGLTPHDMIDIAMCNDLLYDGSSQEGVVFHLISALSQYGKLGILCIGATHKRAEYFYKKTVEVLHRECQL